MRFNCDLIDTLGNKIGSKIDESIIALITSQSEFDSNSKRVKEAKENDIHVVSEDIIDEFWWWKYN